MQKQNIGFVRKYIIYILFLFLSLLFGVVDFFSNSSISNYFPNKIEIDFNFLEIINFSTSEFTENFYSKQKIVSENIRLKQEVQNLRQLVVQNQELVEKLKSFEIFISQTDNLEFQFLNSNLIFINSSGEFLISGGKSSNLKSGDIVLNEEGYVIGYLGEVFNDYSILETFSSVRFSLQAMDQKENMFLLTSNGNSLTVSSVGKLNSDDKVGLIFTDVSFGNIGKFPVLNLSLYQQSLTGEKIFITIPIQEKLTSQTNFYIPINK